MLKGVLKLVLVLPIVVVIVVIVLINIRLNYSPQTVIRNGDTIHYELLKQLQGVKNALNRNADLEMQNIYPEGYVFLNAVYALAWSSFLRHDEHRMYFDEGHAEIHKALAKIDSSPGRAPFNENLPLPYGAFYNGWSSYVLASKLRLEPEDIRNDQEVYHFRQQCDRIATAIQQTTYPQSYFGGAWPADVMLCVGALSLHDQLFEPQYTNVIQNWVVEIKKRLDARGMIPHSVHAVDGSVNENARGSSTALMLVLLYDIDFQFAKEQFQLFKSNFVDCTVGLTGVREYPKGDSGKGDIDSGPMILGFGGAATIVGMQTLSLFGEHELSLRIRNTIEALAFSRQNENLKTYFFDALPIADAFIAWSHSKVIPARSHVSFTYFRIFSFLVFSIVSLLLWLLISVKKSAQ